MTRLIRTDPDWAKVLNYLYENDGHHHLPFEDGLTEIQRKESLRRSVCEKLKLNSKTDKELRRLFNHLERVDLAKLVTEPDWAEVRLTELGFEVAHERVLTHRQHWINKILAMFTGGLLFAAIIQAVSAYFNTPTYEQNGLASIIVFAGVLIICAVLLINFRL